MSVEKNPVGESMYCFAKRISCALLALSVAPVAQAAVCYVTTAGAGTNSGAAWASPYDLQTALGNTGCTEIWVAKGIYKPVVPADPTNVTAAERGISFDVGPGVAVYGGFAGTETTRDARNPATNLTVLSGDLSGNDTGVVNGVDSTVPTDGSNADNSLHVVLMDGTTSAGIVTADTVLDGFTITAGNANTGYPTHLGGGLYCNGLGSGHVCSPTMTNLIFSGNSADYGGALYDDGYSGASGPTLTNVDFSGNSATYNGGAMFNDGEVGGSNPVVMVKVTFSGNSAKQYGGAMYNNGEGGNSSPTLTDVTFSGNTSGISGGAIYDMSYNNGTCRPTLTNVTFSGNSAPNGYGGALENHGDVGGTSKPTLTNVTFNGNSANFGGAMASVSINGTVSPTLTNVTFSNNSAATSGGAIFNLFGGGSNSSTLTNVVLWGDALTGSGGSGQEIFNQAGATSTMDHSIVQGGCPAGSTCANLFTGDPLLGPLANNGGFTQTMLPGAGSAAIDAGNDASCPATDQRGVSRPQGAHCDIGAVEVGVVRTGACLVDAGKPAPGDGLSWNTAYPDLQSALRDMSCTEIWVAKGIYKPVVPADPANVTAAERGVSFNVRPGVAVYGGFAGTESTRDARNPATNPTVLSGDLSGNDTGAVNGVDSTVPTDGSNADNSLHVVLLDGTTSAGIVATDTVLDGFTVTAGNANVGSAPTDLGGGLYCKGVGSGHMCSPMLANLAFSGNGAVYGGAIYSDGYGGVSSPTLTNVVFSGNSASSWGGAMDNNGQNGGASSPALSNVTFSGNSAVDGGAMNNDGSNGGTSSPTLTNVTFSGNDATYGGAMYNEGNVGGVSSPMLTNVTFAGNNATYNGGAMFDDGTSGTSSPTLINATFNGNSASHSGGAMFNYGYSNGVSSPMLTNVTFSGNSANYGGALNNDGTGGTSSTTLTNVILWGDTLTGTGGSGQEILNYAGATSTIDHSVVQGGCPTGSTCTNLVAADPKLGTLANNGGFTQTMLPGVGSAAIDAGNDASCPATDQRGVTRPQGAHCDIGAVEVLELATPTIALAFNPSSVNVGGTSTLTATLSNSNSTAVQLDTVDVTITGLPGGASVSVPGSNPAIACSDGSGASDPPIVIPAQSGSTPGTCTLTFTNVSAGTTAGSYPTTWPSGVQFVDTTNTTTSVNTTTTSTATLTVTPAPIDGRCGTDDNGKFLSLGASDPNLCSAGTVSGFNGNGPWTWSCVGTSGGAAASCSAGVPTIAAPTAALNFNPASVVVGETSTLTVILSNSNPFPAELNMPYGSPDVTITGLPGGATLSVPGSNPAVSCSDGSTTEPISIPAQTGSAPGTCMLTFANINAGSTAGSYTATWPSNVRYVFSDSVMTTTTTTATTALRVTATPATTGQAAPAPALKLEMLVLLGALLSVVAMAKTSTRE